MSNPYVDHVNGNNQTIDIYDAALRSTIGQSNGLATLDSNGKLPVSQLPSDSDKLDTAVLTGITESSTVATRAYAESDRFFLEPTGEYCMATSAISIGETLVENTNYTVITLEGVVASILTMGDQLNTIKADKVLSVTNGNLAGLNGSGNLTDSGWNGAKDTTSISGNPISISGLKANQLAINPIITFEPIQDLHGQSKPYPAGGGKNLIPMTVDSIKVANTAGTWSGNVYTYNGVTVTIITDNANNIIEFKVNGTCTGSSWAFTLTSAIPVSSGSYYINGNGSSATARLRYKNGSDWVYTNTIGSTDTPITLDSAYNLLVDIYIPNSTTFTNLLLHPMIRLSTVSDATFAPYSNISPISGYDKIEVLSCGKNIFNGEVIQGRWSHTDGTWVEQATFWATKNPIPVIGGQSNYISNVVYRAYYDKNMTFISGDGTGSAVVTTPTNAVWMHITQAKADWSSPSTTMVAISNTAIDYVPYHKTTDLSESLGQTVYGGTLDVRTGVLTVTHKAIDMGDLNYVYGGGRFNSTTAISDVGGNASWYYGDVIFSMYRNSGDSTDATAFIYSNVGTASDKILYVYDSRYTDATAFKTAVTGQKLVYPLATPVEIQLTPHEISLLKDYAYVSTNGTTIALDYHNGELASLADVSQLGETVNEILSNQTAIFSPSQNVSGVSEKHFFKVGNLVNISCRVTGTFNNGAYTDIGTIAYRPLNIMWFPLINRATGTLAGVIRLTTDGIISVLPSANLTDTYINLMFIANKQ